MTVKSLIKVSQYFDSVYLMLAIALRRMPRRKSTWLCKTPGLWNEKKQRFNHEGIEGIEGIEEENLLYFFVNFDSFDHFAF